MVFFVWGIGFAQNAIKTGEKLRVHEQVVDISFQNGEPGDNYGTPAFDHPDYYYASIQSPPSGVYYRQAGLSPDGEKIIAQKSYPDGSYSRTEIVLMNADGSGEIIISAGDSGEGDIYAYMNPFWSDDGNYIGFCEVHNTVSNKVMRYEIATTTTIYIYEPVTTDVSNPDFIGSSTTSIVFWAYGPAGGADLFTWDGTNLVNLTNTADYKEYEPVSNGDGTVILFWSGETTAEPVNTTHTLTNVGGVWTKDVSFTPIADTYWSYWTDNDCDEIGTTVMSTKDLFIYNNVGAFVLDLTGPGYSGGSGSWNFFGSGIKGPDGEMLFTSNAGRTVSGRDIAMAAPREELFVDASNGSDSYPGTENAPFATIQKGINEVSIDGTVNVFPGNYDETAPNSYLNGTPYQFGLFFSETKPGVTVRGLKADGNTVADFDDIAAFVTTNATNSFGTAGVFVAGDNITMSGLEIGPNNGGDNKAIEVIGDNFTINACRLNVEAPIYIGDFDYDDNGTPTDYSDDVSSIQSYTISNCHFFLGDVYIANGAGWTGSAPGSVTGRSITGNTFEGWQIISFAGYTPNTGWLNYPTGAATISGNTFTNTDPANTRFIQSWGAVQADFPYADYWDDNTFPAKTLTSVDGNLNHVRGYDSGDFLNIKRIGKTIQQRINFAQSGDIIFIGPGTYNETITVDKLLTLDGAGSGSDPSLNTIIYGPGSGNGLSLISGNSATERMVIKDVYITNFFTGVAPQSYATLDNVSVCYNTGAGNRGVELGNLQDLIISNCKFNHNSIGMRAGTAADIDNITITNSEFNDNVQGWFIAKASGTDASDLSNVNVSYSTFNDNLQKGIYVEKLSNALFNHITVSNSGTDPTYGFNNGIDINLKYQAYQNITIQNSTITGSGSYGTASSWDFPSAVTIKARDDSPSYNTDPATLSDVTISNCTISGPENALRFGEAGKTNAGPYVDVTHSTLSGGNLHGNTGFGIINNTLSSQKAENNY